MKTFLILVRGQVISIGLGEVVDRPARSDIFLDNGPNQGGHLRVSQVDANHPEIQSRIKWIKKERDGIGENKSIRFDARREILKERIRPTVLLEEKERR